MRLPSFAIMKPMDYPGVGVGVYIRRDGKILFGLRNGVGAGTWCAPGGKLDMYESWEDCAHREVEEETGITIDNVRFMATTNDMSRELKTHFVTIHMVADWVSGEAQVLEPDKCVRWEWRAWHDLPKPYFHPSGNFIKMSIDPFSF